MTAPTHVPLARTRLWVGLLVAVLLLGHLVPLFVLGRGTSGLDWNVMAGRWARPAGRIWDLLLVWSSCGYAALLVQQRTRGHRDRLLFGICCAAVVLVALVVGSLAILSFDPDLG